MNKKKLYRFVFIASFVLLLILPQFFLEYTSRFYFFDDLQVLIHEQLRNLGDELRIISDLRAVGRQNAELSKTVSELRVRLLMNEAIKRENEELSRLLKLKDSYGKYAIIPAKILNYSETNPNRISIGYPEEYAKLMAEKSTVVSSMGLVGLVTSFYATRAEVELISSKNFTIPAVLENREECTAILKGNGQSLSIHFLDKVCNTPSAEGKRLLSANLSENYSIPYIPIGIISTLHDDETNILFTKGEAIPLFKKGKLNHIFIVVGTNTKENPTIF